MTPDERLNPRPQKRVLRGFQDLAFEFGLTDQPDTPSEEETVGYQRDSCEVKPNPELDLHGFRAKDAILEVDSLLNGATLAGLSEVKIIHGKGSGTLRTVVREYLEGHPMVESWSPFDIGDNEAEGAVRVIVASSR